MKTRVIDLSIVIPTLNEEKFIGPLLDSIAAQTVAPKEIVVVDAYSKDQTRAEIKKRQKSLPLEFFQIPKDTISRQRNFGAHKTSSENILFLDADVELLENNLLQKYYQEIQETKPDIAVAEIMPLSNYWKNKVFFGVMNLTIKMLKSVWPIAPAINIYVSRTIFDKVGGFDEKIRIGEDAELIQRIVKAHGKFVILKRTKIHTSTRRFDKEGRRKFSLKMVKSFYYVNTKGFRNNPIEYELGKHKAS